MRPARTHATTTSHRLRPTVVIACLLWAASASAVICENAVDGTRQLYWGDLHAHTAHSLDAYAFGSIATPKEAYAFARGQSLRRRQPMAPHSVCRQ